MFPRPFHWAMLALNSATIVSNTCSLICVLDTFNTEVTLFRILSLDGIICLMFAFFSAITHGLSAWGFMPEGKVKCSLILMTCMPPYINGILCSLMISVIRFMSLTSKNQIRIKHWMTSTRIIRITSGFVYFAIIYGVTTSIINALLDLNIFPTYTICLMDSEVDNIDNSLVLAFFVMPSVFMAYTTPIFDFVTFRLMKFWSHRSQQIPPDCRNIPLRATVVNTLLWIFNFQVGLFFSISTTEISALNKAMAVYICAAITMMLRHPCVSAFAFRANAESRRLDLKEEKERRRNRIIEEAKKEKALRKEKLENRPNNPIPI